MGLDAGYVAGSRVIVTQSSTITDTTGAIHSVFVNPISHLYFYQRVTPGNVMGVFHKFTENLQVFSGVPLGILLINGDILYVPCTIHDAGIGMNFPGVYRATPLSGPTFFPPAVPGMLNPTAVTNRFNPDNVPRIQFDSTGRMVSVWMAYDGVQDYSDLYIAFNSNPALTPLTWSSSIGWARSIDSPPGFNYGGQQVQLAAFNVAGRQLLVAVDANDPIAPNPEQAYWMGVFSIQPGRIIPASAVAVLSLPDPRKDC
jgi:hypothetical protein